MDERISPEKATLIYIKDRGEIDIIEKQQKSGFVTIHWYNEFVGNSKLKEKSKELT